MSPSIIVQFLKGCKIKLRRVQRKKRFNKQTDTPALMKWHNSLREGLINTVANLPQYDPKRGRFPPDKRFNVDQVPLPFAINRTTTYEDTTTKESRGIRRYESVTLEVDLKNGNALYRFSLLLLKTSVELQLYLARGNRISEDEKVANHKSVDIYW